MLITPALHHITACCNREHDHIVQGPWIAKSLGQSPSRRRTSCSHVDVHNKRTLFPPKESGNVTTTARSLQTGAGSRSKGLPFPKGGRNVTNTARRFHANAGGRPESASRPRTNANHRVRPQQACGLDPNDLSSPDRGRERHSTTTEWPAQKVNRFRTVDRYLYTGDRRPDVRAVPDVCRYVRSVSPMQAGNTRR